MSLYGLYVQEREGKKIFENEKGFITYLEMDRVKTVLVSDFYIKKEYRGTGVAKELCDKVEEIVREKKYRYAMATVDVSTNNWQHSQSILEHYGFKPSGKEEYVIYFIKEFNYG